MEAEETLRDAFATLADEVLRSRPDSVWARRLRESGWELTDTGAVNRATNNGVPAQRMPRARNAAEAKAFVAATRSNP